MSLDLYRWWGLRVREPLGANLGPLRRTEVVIVGLLTSTILEMAWLTCLVLRQIPPTDLAATLLTPVLLLISPSVVLAFVPNAVFETLGIAPALMLARERGGLRSWDQSVIVGALVCAGCFLLSLGQPIAVTAIALAGSAGSAALGLGFLQEQVTSFSEKHRAEVPDWLKNQISEERPAIPESGAESVLTFETIRGKAHQVGVRIPEELVARLRSVNAKHDGRLWQSDPTTVVLANRAPIDGEVAETLRRLCAQLLSLSVSDTLSRWELANQVLAMVQREISYSVDRESTASFTGGPFEEYGRFALETVNDRTGDCECTAILCASILAYLGYNPALVLADVTDEAGRCTGHCMVGVKMDDVTMPSDLFADLSHATATDGTQYICGETAVDGTTLSFGVLPLSMRHRVQITQVLPIGTVAS